MLLSFSLRSNKLHLLVVGYQFSNLIDCTPYVNGTAQRYIEMEINAKNSLRNHMSELFTKPTWKYFLMQAICELGALQHTPL